MQSYKPHSYQVYCRNKIIELPNIALFLEMGLGKTAITLDAIRELRYNYFQAGKVLIIAPKKVAESTWESEAAKWQELAGLTFSRVLGTAVQRVDALRRPADIYLINRENTQWLVDYYKRAWPFDMVVIDESSSFKSHKAKRFKALKLVRSRIRRMVLLTGTPSPKSLIDLWAQLYLLDEGKRLGRTISSYRDTYFVPDKRNQTTIFSYAPREGADKEIYNRISDICISMRSADYLELPELIYDDVPVMLDEKATRIYKKLERETLLQIDDDTAITAGTAAVLTNKLLQLCNGAVYDEQGAVIELQECKLEALIETIEQLGDEHAMVCYNFKHDKDRILRALSGSGKRVAVYEGPQQEQAWNAGDIDLLLVQPASCGYGLNLQAGGHHIIWFGLTWSLELYQQTNKRLHRQGQDHPVIVHHLIVQGGVDEDVLASLQHKGDSQDSLLNALKARIFAVRH
ncbi:MAG: DEAD/DEAH box helicase [Ruminococcus sp.]|nr:DEAD/DEAH box helicase [Ruminococcus sp.]MBR6103322.1 DEAD/DEAH box helicase [Ruminococcus sp.]